MQFPKPKLAHIYDLLAHLVMVFWLIIWQVRFFTVFLQPKCKRNILYRVRQEIKEQHFFSLTHLLKLMVRYWQWFLLSVVICLCGSLLYVRYATPVYRFSARILIQEADNYSGASSKRMLKYVNNVGFVSKTYGVENEAEMLWSSNLMRDMVKSLKLYTDYRVKGWPKSRIVYATQPVCVDLDPVHLDSIDRLAYEEYCTVSMRLKRKNDHDSTILAKGFLMSEDSVVWAFSRQLDSLPAAIKTPFGTLTFTWNPQGEPMTAEQQWRVDMEPPLGKALEYLGRLDVKMKKEDYDNDRWLFRHYFKMSSIVSLTITDRNIHRGMDILKQMAVSYNRLANEEKNEIALRTEAFINERIASLSEELNMSDSSIEQIKREGSLTAIADAARSVVQANKYSSKLTETGAQKLMLDYLEEYIRKPENRYEIIPSNMGLENKASEMLIDQYNEVVQERKRLLHSAAEGSPQVMRLTAEAENMSAAIRTAIKQARRSTEIEQQRFESQYETFKEKVDATPVTERALTDEGRQQKIKDRLLRLLLQKREENSIALASTSDHGRLIDEPILEGKVHPNLWKAYGTALGVGIGIPYVILLLLGLLRYKVGNRKDLEKMTERPIIAEVPMVGDDARDRAGIVIRFGVNEAITEAFRLMRANIHFMLKGGENVILITSSTSGEGKTFCAANLAMSYALLGKRVILCGLDIRRPALGKLFEHTDRSRGISILLQKNQVTAEDVDSQIQPSGIDPHLDLLQAGPIPPNPAELFGRDSFTQVVSILRKEYDYVIFDTAPVGLVTDTLLIGRHAHVSVFVCRAGYTPNMAVGQLNQLAEEHKLPNTCFVLNGE